MICVTATGLETAQNAHLSPINSALYPAQSPRLIFTLYQLPAKARRIFW